MATKRSVFVQSDGAYANGMNYATAAGGLPARITCEADLVTSYRGGNATFSRQTPDVDGTSVWVNNYGIAKLRKYSIALGTLLSDNAVPACMDCVRRPGDSTYIYTVDYTNHKVLKFRMSDGALISTSAALGPTGFGQVAITGDDTCWAVHYSAGAALEYTMSTGAATGRSLSGSPSVYDLITDGTYLYRSCPVSFACYQYRLADAGPALVATKTWSFINDYGNYLGHSYSAWLGSFSIDPSGNFYVTNQFSGKVWQLTAAGGGPGAAACVRQVMWGDPQFSGGVTSGPAALSGAVFRCGVLQWSPDARYVWVPTATDTGNSNAQLNRRVNVLTQTWICTRTMPAGCSVFQIDVGGKFGNLQDSGFDFTRTKFYYTISGVKTYFTPGARFSAVNMGGASVTWGIEINNWGMPACPYPYLDCSAPAPADASEPAGVFMAALYDDGVATREWNGFSRGMG